MRAFTALTFTDAVRAAQHDKGTREHCEALERAEPSQDHLTERSAAAIRICDSFIIGTVNAQGWPYLQHRGGPAGFLRILGPRTLAFADYAGNRQYITVGNLRENDRVMLLVLNHATRLRLKIWGRGQAVAPDSALLEQVATPDYPAEIERVIRIEIAAWDFNCRKHIPIRPQPEQAVALAMSYQARLVEAQRHYDALFDMMFAEE